MERVLESETLVEAVPHEYLVLSPVPRAICTKQIKGDKTIRHKMSKEFSFRPVRFDTADEFFSQLEHLQSQPYSFIVRGHPARGTDLACDVRRIVRSTGEGTVAPAARRWVTLDIDALPTTPEARILTHEFDPQDPLTTVLDVVELLPRVFHDVSFHWRYSSSAGFKKDAVSCHLSFVMDSAMTDEDLKRYFSTFNESFMAVYGRRLIDTALFNPIQPHYTAAPIIEGIYDPMPKRSGIFKGANDVVPISREWVSVGEDDHGAERAYMRYFDAIGDDQDGFHHPIMQGIASWINFHGEPEGAARSEIKRLVRSYVSEAQITPSRQPYEIERYKSDQFLDSLIDGAVTKGFARGTKLKVDLSDLTRALVYVAFDDVFYHPDKDLRLSVQSIKNSNAAMAPNKNIAKLLLESPDLRTVDTLEYVPGVEERFSMFKGRRVYNMWRPRTTIPVDGSPDVSVMLNHLRFLVDGDEEAFHHLSRGIAWVLARPGRRIRHAIVIGSKYEGTGKSYLKQIFQGIIGKDQVTEIGTDQLKEQYNDWATKAEVVFIEELMAEGRLEIANRLKPLITEDNITIRRMRTDSFVSRNPANFFATTNHRNAIMLDKNSRRYWVWYSEAPPRDPGYYKQLFGWTNQNLGAIYRWALDYDFGDFNPEAPPPKTKHFIEMVDVTESPMVAFIKEAIATNDWPFACDLVTTTDMVEALSSVPGLRAINPISLGHLFRDLNLLNLGQKRMPNGTKPKFWCVRNKDTWKSASESDIAKHYVAPGRYQDRNIAY